MEQYIINTIKDNLESIENNLSAISANANVISHVAGQVKYVNKATRNVAPVAKMTAEQIYSEVGFIENKHGAPHYTHICYLCYEEFGYQIGRALFPETF